MDPELILLIQATIKNPWLILFIIVIVILIVWLALLRNVRTYKPDFEMHGHVEEQHVHDAEDH